jgi:hypothetical protein
MGGIHHCLKKLQAPITRIPFPYLVQHLRRFKSFQGYALLRSGQRGFPDTSLTVAPITKQKEEQKNYAL